MVEFTKVSGRDVGEVRMLALSTCVWCKRTKAFLTDNRIEFSYLDVDLLTRDDFDEVAAEWSRFNPGLSFPTIVVNSREVIIGYDLNALQRLAGA